jgi:hypothetical protein
MQFLALCLGRRVVPLLGSPLLIAQAMGATAFETLAGRARLLMADPVAQPSASTSSNLDAKILFKISGLKSCLYLGEVTRGIGSVDDAVVVAQG